MSWSGGGLEGAAAPLQTTPLHTKMTYVDRIVVWE